VNRYPAPPAGSESVSRGLLLLSVLDGVDVDEVESRVGGADLTRFAPFTLVAFQPGRATRAMAFDGSLIVSEQEHSGLVVTSSSVDQARADTERRAVFARAAGDLEPDRLVLLHADHAPVRGATSVCMHRDDAATVSFTRVDVDHAAVALAYQAGAPCVGGGAVHCRLTRVGARRGTGRETVRVASEPPPAR
jgi:hypothetical protein